MTELLLQMKLSNDQAPRGAKQVLDTYRKQGHAEAEFPLETHAQYLQSASASLFAIDLGKVHEISQSEALNNFNHSLDKLFSALNPRQTKNTESENV